MTDDKIAEKIDELVGKLNEALTLAQESDLIVSIEVETEDVVQVGKVAALPATSLSVDLFKRIYPS